LVTENSLSNPYFIQSINQSKQIVYEAWSAEIIVWH
jgi:hypothetical protein